MAPVTLLTRIVPQATSLPRVSKEITQTITRRGRSSAASILLGSSTTSKFSTAQAATVRSATSHVAVMNPRSTTPQVNVGGTTSLSTGAIVGIVLGSILGFLVLLVLGYKFCFNRRSATWVARYDGDGNGDEMVYRERRVSGEGRGRIWKSGARGGGGEEWEMKSEYCDGDWEGVRRPDKAVVKEKRRGRERRYRRTRRERDRKWNDNDNDGYDRRNRSRGWEIRGNQRGRSRNTWVVIERRGILGWGRPGKKFTERNERGKWGIRKAGEELEGGGVDRELRFVVPD
ncbi:hypothetical protein BPAE_0359g00030 [Botrytis paeoniae]|uniref:Uncharacterized protein n=1 Tax=Botrytis paeoniae TaxID=278948 RepID=A0A4Z1FBY3_9HELO|nr:hypothetical protein BPAE_0359g00030 [Botrytis paeoniae]